MQILTNFCLFLYILKSFYELFEFILLFFKQQILEQITLLGKVKSV